MKRMLALLALCAAFAGVARTGRRYGVRRRRRPDPPGAGADAKAPAAPAAAPAAASGRSRRSRTAAAAAPAAAEPAAAAAPPTPNKGDNAWMIVATLLVIMMSIPGLALFYGGLVRSKNMLSVLMQVFVIFSLIIVLWAVYGYSVAFTEDGAFFGGVSRLFLSGIFTIKDGVGSFATAATFSKGVVIPEYLFIVFQATFAAITVALIVGAFAERMKFAAVLLFAVLWFTFAYLPIAHMVWFWPGPDGIKDAATLASESAKAGWLWQKGALDFAGGTVVHINAGVAGIVGAFVLGKRVGYGRDSMAPHNLTFTMIGASLLWVGWFGFNAGSALEAGGRRRPRVHQHARRHRRRRAVLDVRRVDAEGQAVDAGRGIGRRRGPGRDHAGLRLRRRQRRADHRAARRRRLPLGRQRPQAAGWVPTTRWTCSACTASAGSWGRC